MSCCMKCTAPNHYRWCPECRVLMGKPGPAISETRRKELGIYITPMDKQVLEPIPFVMDVEHWPELFKPARPTVACYNGRVTSPPS